MNAVTPNEIRALANNADWRAEKLDHAEDRRAVRQYETALRAAADQIEAVQQWCKDKGAPAVYPDAPFTFDKGVTAAATDVLAILTGDSASQDAL